MRRADAPHTQTEGDGHPRGCPGSLRRPAAPHVAGRCGREHATFQEGDRRAHAWRRADPPSGISPGGTKPDDTTNQRNGTSAKTVLTDDGPLRLDIPRDRDGTFEPQLIGKHERRFTGFDDKILALYARGLTVREIQAFLREMYVVEVSPDFISTVTDAVHAEVTAWQRRPLEPLYPVVFFDALRVKIRDEATVRSKAVYLALGMLPDGRRDILGIWIEQTEGAKFWMKVFADLQSRGCQDVLIAVTDGLKGMS